MGGNQTGIAMRPPCIVNICLSLSLWHIQLHDPASPLPRFGMGPVRIIYDRIVNYKTDSCDCTSSYIDTDVLIHRRLLVYLA